MPNLICNVKNCSYNHEDYCCLSQIQVGENHATNKIETCCESFNEEAYISNNCALETKPVVSIKCSATNCIYNETMVCTAECVPISATSTSCCNVDDTLCGAFVCQ